MMLLKYNILNIPSISDEEINSEIFFHEFYTIFETDKIHNTYFYFYFTNVLAFRLINFPFFHKIKMN